MPWRPMAEADLGPVHALAEQIHVDHPERLAVLAERRRLFSAGCHVLDHDDAIRGYAIGHPWTHGQPPALDSFLGTLPARPTTFYVHDVAISTPYRARGFAAQALSLMEGEADRIGLDNLSLSAVNNSRFIWEKRGFVVTDMSGLAGKLQSYGADAVFMIRKR